jgi:tetratricopeptide (TPR) repeat protein
VRQLLDRHDAGSPVAPLDASSLAYWQRSAETQPDFLKVAVLEREQRWQELAALASAWSRNDAGDPEAWYILGTASAQLEHWPAAREALERAVALQPGSGPAWYRLGAVCASMKQFDRAGEALATLVMLDPALATDLKQLIDKEKA